MDNMTFGKYIPLDSYIHRLDPRLKICSLMIFLITIFFNIGFIGYGIMALYVVVVALLSKIGLKQVFKAVKPMMIMALVLFIFNVFFMKTGDVAFALGGFKVYWGAIFQSLYIFIRLVLIITLTTILTASTKPLELTLGLELLMKPLKKLHFPVHELAMMISIALRFIPDLIDETKRIMKAQTSRGVDFNEGKMMEKIGAIVSLIIPLFISAFQKAEDLANAMESRNYNPEAKRTRYKQLTWKMQDTLSLTVTLVLCFGLIVMSFLR